MFVLKRHLYSDIFFPQTFVIKSSNHLNNKDDRAPLPPISQMTVQAHTESCNLAQLKRELRRVFGPLQMVFSMTLQVPHLIYSPCWKSPLSLLPKELFLFSTVSLSCFVGRLHKLREIKLSLPRRHPFPRHVTPSCSQSVFHRSFGTTN